MQHHICVKNADAACVSQFSIPRPRPVIGLLYNYLGLNYLSSACLPDEAQLFPSAWRSSVIRDEVPQGRRLVRCCRREAALFPGRGWSGRREPAQTKSSGKKTGQLTVWLDQFVKLKARCCDRLSGSLPLPVFPYHWHPRLLTTVVQRKTEIFCNQIIDGLDRLI